MIKTGVIVSNPFQENTIVLSDSTDECIIVDAGGYHPAGERGAVEILEQNGCAPSWPSIRTVMWTICSA